MSKLISVDSGKGKTKFKSLDVQGRFVSKYQSILDKDYDIVDDNYIVRFNGERYLIGDLATGKDNSNKKSTLLHKLCIYAAITKCIKPNKLESIKLGIGCPISLYLDNSHKKEYASFVKNDGKTIEISVNGEDYKFKIENLLISAEGSGFLYENIDQIQEDNIFNIDIGNLNINGIGFRGGKPIPSSMITLNNGYNTLRDMANDSLCNYNEGKKFSDLKLDKTLDNEVLSMRRKDIPETKNIIKKVKKEYLNKIINDLRERTDLDQYDEIHFSGGGVVVLKEYLNGSNWSIGNDTENVNGYFTRLVNKYA